MIFCKRGNFYSTGVADCFVQGGNGQAPADLVTNNNHNGKTMRSGMSGRMNKRKSAVDVARKMVSLAWLLMKRKDYYHGVSSAAKAALLQNKKNGGRGGLRLTK
jgi:hypothetical protein